VVYGSRFLGRHRAFMFSHYVGNRVLTFITNLLYNTMLTDMETCYKVMRTDVLRSMKLRSNGFGIEPELTAKSSSAVTAYTRCRSRTTAALRSGKEDRWRDGLVALWILLRYRFTE